MKMYEWATLTYRIRTCPSEQLGLTRLMKPNNRPTSKGNALFLERAWWWIEIHPFLFQCFLPLLFYAVLLASTGFCTSMPRQCDMNCFDWLERETDHPFSAFHATHVILGEGRSPFSLHGTSWSVCSCLLTENQLTISVPYQCDLPSICLLIDRYLRLCPRTF